MLVIGFPKDFNKNQGWNYDTMKYLTAKQKYEYALTDERILLFDNVFDWMDDLNTNVIDTENYYYFIVKI